MFTRRGRGTHRQQRWGGRLGQGLRGHIIVVQLLEETATHVFEVRECLRIRSHVEKWGRQELAEKAL